MERVARFAGHAASAFAGGLLALAFARANPDTQALEERKRQLAPRRVILLRHGESEGNADHTLYRTVPDNAIELTDRGSEQARAAGERIRKLVGNESVYFFCSPFERTLQTLRNVRDALDDPEQWITHVEPRIREQEFGNLQGDDFQASRDEQKRVGRFWYRFPSGESGCDVYDRVPWRMA